METRKLDKTERKQLSDQAAKARRKQRAGAVLTVAEEEAITAWDLIKKPSGRPRKEAPDSSFNPQSASSATPASATIPNAPSVADSPTTSTPPTSRTEAENSSISTTKPESSSEPSEQPRDEKKSKKRKDKKKSVAPPPPPVILGRVKKGGKRWQDKHGAAGSTESREATCAQFALTYVTLLQGLNKKIRDQGAEPWISDEHLATVTLPAAILTADKFLPDDFAVGPEVEVAFSSGAITVQNFLVAKKNKAKRSKTQEPGPGSTAKVIDIEKAKKVQTEPEKKPREPLSDSQVKADEDAVF